MASGKWQEARVNGKRNTLKMSEFLTAAAHSVARAVAVPGQASELAGHAHTRINKSAKLSHKFSPSGPPATQETQRARERENDCRTG